MARSKSITGEKPARSKTNGKAKKEDQIVETGVTAVSGLNVPAAGDGSATVAQRTAEEFAVAHETRLQEVTNDGSQAESRKLGVVKAESRKNVVVPINLEDEIRRRAYELYQQRGSDGGSEADDWFAAEREIRQRYQGQQQSA